MTSGFMSAPITPDEIARLRAALDVPSERLLVELAITTGLRSGEIRGLIWDSIDLEGRRLFVEHQATRRQRRTACSVP